MKFEINEELLKSDPPKPVARIPNREEFLNPDCAFPQYGRVGEAEKATGGLTKREYFAGLAMQNLQNVLLRKSGEVALERLKVVLGKDGPATIATCAVQQADALIAALREPK